jgi:AAA+ superfamily predicted ATPase
MVSVSVEIADKDYLFDCIKYYSAFLLSKNTKIYSIKLHYDSKFKMKDKTNKIFKKISKGNTNLIYKDIEINIDIKEIGDPIGLETGTKIHSVMFLLININDKDVTENAKLLDEFVDDASKYYIEHIMDKKKEENKTSIYIWDEYWETIEKRLSRKLSTLYLDGKEKEILGNIKKFLDENTKLDYQKMGVPYKLNILLHGLPGTGKSSLIYSLASELEMDVALLYFTKDMTDIDFMRALRRIPENTLLVIEDIDTVFESRKKNDEFKNNISFSGLINSLDGIGYIDKQIIILTTNCKMVLDKALTRPGRIDMDIEFTYATENQIRTMYSVFLPSHTEFDKFYKKVKGMKLTTAMLQSFLFGNRLTNNILDHMDELRKLCDNNDYNTKKESMYC